MKTLGKIACDAFIKTVSEEGYCTSCADWVHLSERYKEGWEEAAKAVLDEQWGGKVEHTAEPAYELYIQLKERGE